MHEQLKFELEHALADLKAHMASWEYAFAMAGGCHGGAEHTASTTGQCPVMRYHHGLMQMILNDRAQIAKAVNATVISLDEASQGYADFDKGTAKKFVFNPHGSIKAA